MKRSLSMSIVAGLASLALAGSLRAGTMSLADSWGSGPGGEFKVTQVSGLSLAPIGANVRDTGSFFQSFCLEHNEYIYFNEQYNFTVSDGATRGGVSGQTSPGYDPLDSRTAYLYTKFWDGVLSGFEYRTDTTTRRNERTADANALQNVIWYLEGEIGVGRLPGQALSGQALTWYNEANNAVNSGAWSGIGNVRVLNLTFTRNHADIGARIGDPGQSQLAVVPLPAAAPMSLAGLCVLAIRTIVRRRRAVADAE